MTKKEFLAANRERVISYYNDEIRRYWKVSLRDFMLDLMNNFRKASPREGYNSNDLTYNLSDAKSRLGCFDIEIKTVYTKPYSESNHAKAVAYFGADLTEKMYNAK